MEYKVFFMFTKKINRIIKNKYTAFHKFPAHIKNILTNVFFCDHLRVEINDLIVSS